MPFFAGFSVRHNDLQAKINPIFLRVMTQGVTSILAMPLISINLSRVVVKKMEYTQQVLPLVYKSNYNPYDFVVSLCNLEAYNAVTRDNIWPHNRLIIVGEKGSGKSHLANIWGTRKNAVYVGQQTNLLSLEYSKNLIFENVETCSDERALLYLINFALENEISLLMTTASPLQCLIPDLKSRINSTYHIFIKTPCLDLIKALLIKHFSDKQISVSLNVIEYISCRIEGSFSSILDIVEYFDRIALEKRREITIAFARDMLGEYINGREITTSLQNSMQGI
ncbi:hypothetical protein [Candidatus Lariskella endosymbiont of Hedychridium roseum]|uniref:hypothetical protein n=2 Tax=unclassified Candidatus Lariskella TaxID=2632605 RepID=UPI0030D509AF